MEAALFHLFGVLALAVGNVKTLIPEYYFEASNSACLASVDKVHEKTRSLLECNHICRVESCHSFSYDNGTRVCKLSSRQATVRNCGTLSQNELTYSIIVHPGITCTFDENLCGWVQDTSADSMDWSRISGGTPSYDTGPSKDHTSGSGHYIYIEASWREYWEKEARLTYTFSTPSPPYLKISLWYHMHGAHMGTLRIISVNEGNQETVRWQASGNKGNKWIRLNLFIHESIKTVILEGERGSDYESDISIDDIIVAM